MKKVILFIFAFSLAFAGFTIVSAQNAPEAPEAPTPPEPPRKAFFGVVTSTVSRSTAIQLGMQPGVGLTVKSVVRDSSAEKAGIEKYDILLKMEDQWLTNVSQFTTLLSMKKPGEKTYFTILRRGVELVQEVELGSKPTAGKDVSFELENKFEEFGERMEQLAEKHELMTYINDPEKLESTVRSALDKVRYRIETIGEDDESRTSVVSTTGIKTIISSEDGTLIVERIDDKKSKLLALDPNDDLIFKGEVSDDGNELTDTEPWVKERFLKLKNKMIRVIIDADIDDGAELDSEEEWEDSDD